MEETQEQALRRLHTTAALIQSEADHDWQYFAEHIEELEAMVERVRNPVVKAAVGLVIVQVYLNGIQRHFDEIDNPIDD